MTLFLLSTLLSADDFIHFVLLSPPDPSFPLISMLSRKEAWICFSPTARHAHNNIEMRGEGV